MCSAGVVGGAALVQYIDQSFFGDKVWLVLGIFTTTLCLLKARLYVVPAVITSGFIIGLWRGSVLESNLSVYKSIIGMTTQLKGKISDDPDIGKNGELILRLNDISVQNHQISGRIWTTVKTNYTIKRGDIVTLDGKLTKGFGNFNAAMYGPKLILAERPQPGDVAGSLRDDYSEKIRLGIQEPEASLGTGFLLGQRRALPPELAEALVITGLTHVIVASGYNLTILVRITRRLLVRTSKYLATAAAAFMMSGFVAVTGASPSMVRASLVTGISLAAWYYGRKIHPLVILPFAAAVTILIDPSYAWNDIGWQLSFTAFAGVMIVAPLLQSYFFGEKKPGTVRQILGETISAFILTLPIMVVAFGQFSNVAILTNILILPLIPLAMLLTFLTGFAGIFSAGLAELIGLPASAVLVYMVNVIDFFAQIEWAQSIITVGPWFSWAAYTLIIITSIYLWRSTRTNLEQNNIIE
jgi:competence protein ComEC